MISAAEQYNYLICTASGEYTRASGREIEMEAFTCGGEPIERLVFHAPAPHLPRISLRVKAGMHLIFMPYPIDDPDYLDIDRSTLAADDPRQTMTRPPKKWFQLIGATLNGRTAINRVDLGTGEVYLDIFP